MRDIQKEIIPMIQNYKEAKRLNNKEQINFHFNNIMELVAPLVGLCVSRISYKAPITFEELELVCYEKLITIIEHYKPEKNVRFTTFAVNDLNFELMRYIRNNQSTIRIPESKCYQLSLIRQKIEAGEKVDKEEFKEYKRVTEMCKFKNIDDYDKISEDYDDVIENIENKEKVQKILENLNKNERDLLINVGMYEMSYADYARKVGITREAVRLRYNKLIKKIRQNEKLF